MNRSSLIASYLCNLKHSHFIVHMAFEGDNLYLKPAANEGVSRRQWVVVLTLALQVHNYEYVCHWLYVQDVSNFVLLHTHGQEQPPTHPHPHIPHTHLPQSSFHVLG